MHFEYDRDKLVEDDIKHGTSDEISAVIEILEEDIEDALPTPHILHINDKRRIFRPPCPPRELQRTAFPHRDTRTQRPPRRDARV